MVRINRRCFVAGAAAAAVLPLGYGHAAGSMKVGFVYIGPVGDHGWTFAHDQARKKIAAEFEGKIDTAVVENVSEGPDSERVIRDLASDGCRLIFTTSFGFMNPTIKVARRFPAVHFEHATGYKRAPNVSTYNARFYEGRAVCGTIAGHLSKAGIAGYIASFPIPEVVMGINAFTLAARKINPNFQTRVLWVSTWYDPAKEADAAKALIDQGADIIAQHTDSPAALQACEQRGLMAFGQAWDMASFAPTAHLTAVVDRWDVYYTQRVRRLLAGTLESTDTWWGFKEGMIEMSPYNDRIPDSVQAAANATRAEIVEGTTPVFAGPISDRDGKLRIANGVVLDDRALSQIDWYVGGVRG